MLRTGASIVRVYICSWYTEARATVTLRAAADTLDPSLALPLADFPF
jgi:hypothetical protein